MILKNNAVFQLVGPSGSGKTHFICKLLRNNGYFEKPFRQIYWHQGGGGESGLTQFEFCKLKHKRSLRRGTVGRNVGSNSS